MCRHRTVHRSRKHGSTCADRTRDSARLLAGRRAYASHAPAVIWPAARSTRAPVVSREQHAGIRRFSGMADAPLLVGRQDSLLPTVAGAYEPVACEPEP